MAAILARAALAILAFAGGALALEVALRVWGPGGQKLFPRYHEAVAYGDYVLRRSRPGAGFVHTSADGSWRFDVNQQGFRSPTPYAHARRPGVRRILVLGDSQAFGYEAAYGDILPVRLEALLRERGINVEVINTGVSGFGNAEELVFLEQEGIRYQPDMVVLTFFRNDFADNVRAGLFAERDGALVEAGKVYAPGTGILQAINSVPALRWLSERSYLYSFAFNAVWNAAKLRSIEQAEGEGGAEVGGVPPHQERLTFLILERMSRFLGERGIPLVIVDVPDIVPTGNVRDFHPSIDPERSGAFARLASAVVESGPTLGPHRGREAFHHPHGDRHVAPFVHATLARALADRIVPMLEGGVDAGRAGGDNLIPQR